MDPPFLLLLPFSGRGPNSIGPKGLMTTGGLDGMGICAVGGVTEGGFVVKLSIDEGFSDGTSDILFGETDGMADGTFVNANDGVFEGAEVRISLSVDGEADGFSTGADEGGTEGLPDSIFGVMEGLPDGSIVLSAEVGLSVVVDGEAEGSSVSIGDGGGEESRPHASRSEAIHVTSENVSGINDSDTAAKVQ